MTHEASLTRRRACSGRFLTRWLQEIKGINLLRCRIWIRAARKLGHPSIMREPRNRLAGGAWFFSDERYCRDCFLICCTHLRQYNTQCCSYRFCFLSENPLIERHVPAVQPIGNIKIPNLAQTNVQPNGTSVKSFAQALTRSKDKFCDISLSQLPRPCFKGEELVISIS